MEDFRKRLKEIMRNVDGSSQFIEWFCRTPFLRAARIAKGENLLKGEEKCPFCGDIPRLAFLDKNERKRFLHCLSCGQSWLYYRLKCPFCGNKDQEKLSYLSNQEDPSIRLDVCKNCMTYIKNFDLSKKIPEFGLEIENLLTLHYDGYAELQGYKNKNPF